MPKRRPPFSGELMRCALCGREEYSDPCRNMHWRCVSADGQRVYACPQEFPPDGASEYDFEAAYMRLFAAALEVSPPTASA